MLFDSLKRLFGLDSSSTRSPSNSAPMIEDDQQLVPFRQQLPPDICQIESEFAHVHELMEQQIRAMMGSFGFIYRSPFAGFGFEDVLSQQPNRSHPFSSGIEIRDFEDNENPGNSPADSPELDSRDVVLKPQFRSNSSNKWTGQDQILDERLEAEGPKSILDVMKPSNKDYGNLESPFDSFSQLFGNGLFRTRPSGPNSLFEFGPQSGSITSRSTVTIYTNVNGRKSFEKITHHPDGKIERTVISDDESPQ